MLGITSNRRVYDLLRKEVDPEIAGPDTAFTISHKRAKNLPYLEACVREGIRLYQPIFQLRERVVPPGGDEINGYRIPGGTFIGLNTHAMQLSYLFGHDPETFRPERWLTDDGEHLDQMLKALDLVFGYGPTKCLGYDIAYMQLLKVVFEVSYPLRFIDGPSGQANQFHSSCETLICMFQIPRGLGREPHMELLIFNTST
jgi:cytochrome P450